jgi:hypothetical protein
MSSGLTSCGSSEEGARPGSFCLEGKECTRQSPHQSILWLSQGPEGAKRGPQGPDPLQNPVPLRPSACQRLYEITGLP